MALIPQQDIVTVSKHFATVVDFAELTDALRKRLEDYPAVRIASISATVERSRGTLVAVVETV